MINFIKSLLGLHIHEWDRWDDVQGGMLYSSDNEWVGEFIVQRRDCKICGKAKFRTVNKFVV